MACRRTCLRRSGRGAASTRNISARASSGPDYDPMAIPDPSSKDFQVADLTLPKSVSETGSRKPAGIPENRG